MYIKVTGAGPLLMHQLAPNGVGSSMPGPAGVRIVYAGTDEVRAADIPPESLFVITVVGTVAAELIARGLADWLTDNFQGRSERVEVSRRVVELDDRGQVARVIEEQIVAERKGG